MKRSVIASTIVHAIVFLAILLMPRSPAHWDRADAIAVDLVGPLRSKSSSAASPPAAAPAEEPKAEPAPPPEPAKAEPVAPKEPSKKPAPKRAPQRRYQPIAPPSTDEPSLEERLRQRLGEVEGETPEAPDETAGPVPTPENPGEGKGDSPTSTAEVSATDFPYAWYLNLLRTKISDAWDPPASRLLSGRANQVIVRFRLARSGGVTDVDVEVVSGAPGLDSSARRAVDRAQPFPPLPDGYPEEFVDVAVRFTVSEGRR